MQMTEQFILLQASNPASVENGRKLSRKGSFSNHQRTEDSTLYWAECVGSGKTPYRISIDWGLSESTPTCRCSCPSRQLPCKHAIGLMFEILADKVFDVADPPADLTEKRTKQAAKAAKREEGERQSDKPKKVNTVAQKKKVTRQLEGLDKAEKMLDELLTAGIGTLAGISAQSFDTLAKELGNYYLTGPQMAFSRIALTMRQIQQHPEEATTYYAEAMRILIALHATIKKSREFLNGKLEADNFSTEDSILYEALGGIWRLEDLHAIGAYREHARLVQLSFDVSFDEARREYIERGFWLDLDQGTLSQTQNFRPIKALKYVRADDSCFDVVEVPVLYEYPGEYNRRIRWNDCTTRPLTPKEQCTLPSLAKANIAEVVKLAKGQMKNTLLPKYIPALLPVGQIGMVEKDLVLADPAGNRILLRDRCEDGPDHESIHRLHRLSFAITVGSAIFGLMFYDKVDRRICLHPYSVVTPEEIIRLQY